MSKSSDFFYAFIIAILFASCNDGGSASSEVKSVDDSVATSVEIPDSVQALPKSNNSLEKKAKSSPKTGDPDAPKIKPVKIKPDTDSTKGLKK